MFIYIGIWEAILVLIVVILLTMLAVWWYWRRRLRELEELHERHLAEEISDIIKGFEHQAVNCLRPIKDNLHLIKGRMKRLSVAEGEEWHHALRNSLGVIEYYE